MYKINGVAVVVALASQYKSISKFDALCVLVTVALVTLMVVR